VRRGTAVALAVVKLVAARKAVACVHADVYQAWSSATAANTAVGRVGRVAHTLAPNTSSSANTITITFAASTSGTTHGGDTGGAVVLLTPELVALLHNHIRRTHARTPVIPFLFTRRKRSLLS
jgi:hypothetical protein